MAVEILPAIAAPRMRAPEVVFGPFEFDPNARLLKKDGLDVPLPPRVLAVLELLIRRPGDVVSRQEIIDTVWKDAFVTDTSLAEAVSFLRQALGDDPQSPSYIQTVHRRGYRFVAPVSERVPGEAPPAPALVPIVLPAPVRPSIANELVPWSVAIVAVTLAVSAVWYSTRVEPAPAPVVRLTIDAGPGLRFDNRAPALAISASGTMAAWSGCDAAACRLYLRPLEQLSSRVIPGTDGAAAPFFSPDERWVGFFADGKLKKVAVAGGAPQVVADASQPFGAAWMQDGRIVFAASAADGLWRVGENGGTPERLTTVAPSAGEVSHAYPAALPDGDAVLFTAVTSATDGVPGRLGLLPYPGGSAAWRAVAEGADVGVAVGREYIAFARGADVHAVAFDRVRQTTAGSGQIVLTGASAPHVAGSATGAFIAALDPRPDDSPGASAWAWSHGASAPALRSTDVLLDARLSPDGLHLATIAAGARPDVWILDLDRGTKTRLTHSGATAAPVWNAAGSEVFYAFRRTGPYEIWTRAAAGVTPERVVLALADRHVFPSSVSARGDLAIVATGTGSRSDVGVLRAGERTPSFVVATPFDELAPAISPDGSLLAYQTDESGRWEIVLLRFADGRRVPVSTAGGTRPQWSPDGRTLYFERGLELLQVDVTAGALAAPPRTALALNGARAAGISPGGGVLLQTFASPQPAQAVLTLNWISELRSKLGPATAPSPR